MRGPLGALAGLAGLAMLGAGVVAAGTFACCGAGGETGGPAGECIEVV
jgi:hypothetical protein